MPAAASTPAWRKVVGGEFLRCAKYRADRRAEPFRQTNRDGIEMAADLGNGHLQMHRRVEYARAVQMQA